MQGQKRNIYIFALGIFPLLVNGVINSLIHENAWLYWGAELVYWIIIPSLCLYLYLSEENANLSDLGFKKNLFGRESVMLVLFFGFVLFLVDISLYSKTLKFFWSAFPFPPSFSYQDVTPDQGMAKVLVVLYFALTAAFVEEGLFRGLFRVICEKAVPYVVISSVLFGLIHWESSFANVLATTVLGAFFACIYLWIKNIWPLIIAHCLVDIVWFA